jgi:hypothetical protein
MVAELIINDMQWSVESMVSIDILKTDMNKNRSYFNWDHLNIL